MDALSHAIWGFAVLRGRGPRTARWGLLSGAAPDLHFFLPVLLRQIANRASAALSFPNGRDPNIWRKDGPPTPPDLIDTYDHYYVLTHSLVLLAVLAPAW